MSASEGPRVLFVDDDTNILDSFRRTYRNHLSFEVADSGRAALLMLREKGPFAVIVSDQRMPQMTGIQLLSEVRQSFPETIRIMLTGNADQETAIAAVNSGQIYRFLTKPCPPATLLNAVQDGLRIWSQRALEVELLDGTLSGSISILTEVLGTIHPDSYGQNQRVLQMVRHIANTLKLPDIWQYETAAMLSQIGCVALDATLLARVNAGYELSPEETALFRSHPDVGSRMIRKLPRMAPVADMISNQLSELGDDLSKPLTELTPAQIGGQVLRVALLVDMALRRGKTFQEAVENLLQKSKDLRSDILYALQAMRVAKTDMAVRPVRLKGLRIGHILADDVRAETGMLLASKGQVLTEMMLERFRAFATSIGLREPILILQPMLGEVEEKRTGD